MSFIDLLQKTPDDLSDVEQVKVSFLIGGIVTLLLASFFLLILPWMLEV